MVNLFQNQFPVLHFCQHYTRYLSGTKKCKYRILGVAHQKDNENVLIFNMDDTEIRIPTSTNEVSAPNNNTPDTISDSKSVLAYPADWMNSFGNNYYTQSQAPELTEFTVDKKLANCFRK